MAWHWSRGKPQPVSTQWDRSPVPQPDYRLEALYAWERRCRGYGLFGEPVALEPQFAPYVPNLPLERAGWDRLPQPRDAGPREWRALQVLLPPGEKVAAAQTAALFAAWRGLGGPLSLEIVATGGRVTYQIAVSESDAQVAAAAFASPLPQARLEGGEDALHAALRPLLEYPLGYKTVDWGLYHPAYQPLRIFESLLATPHQTLLGQLGALRAGEMAGLQLLVQPAAAPWGHSLAELVAQFDSPGTRESDLERALRLKLASPWWAAALRTFAAVAGDPDSAHQGELTEAAFGLCRRTGAVLESLGGPDPKGLPANALLALDDAGYPAQEHLKDVLQRRSRRTGMLLCQDELLGLWHPPTEGMNHPKLWRYDPNRRELPEELRTARGSYLGRLDLPGEPTEQIQAHQILNNQILVPWPDAFRNRHAYFLGATRMGKSTLLLNLMVQDMRAGRGLCLIDPHGDLALDMLDRVPPEREKDVLFLDLSDAAYPPAIGLLETADEWEQRLLVSDLLAILHRLFRASWGDRLEHILRHTLLTLLNDTRRHTLRDIRPLLANEAYRRQVVGRLPDADLRAFWHGEFPSYSAGAFAPIYNKLGLLMSSPTVRNIISGKEARLHPGEVIRDRKILIVNLAQSLIGEDNAHFLGALFVTKVQLAAMHNLRRGRGERTEFTLYVDEFQNFVVSSFEKILSEAGKAGLSLVMANQFLEQLGDGLQTAILSNVGTLASFRVSAESGRRLEREFGGFYGAGFLTDMERGQAVVRLGKAGDSYAIRTFPPPKTETNPGIREAVIERTRAQVCRPRAEVEAEFRTEEAALEDLLAGAEADAGRPKGKAASGRAGGKARSATDTAPGSGVEAGNGGPEPWDAAPAESTPDTHPTATGPYPGPQSSWAAEAWDESDGRQDAFGDWAGAQPSAPAAPARQQGKVTAEPATPADPSSQSATASAPGTKKDTDSQPKPTAPIFFGLSEEELPTDPGGEL